MFSGNYSVTFSREDKNSNISILEWLDDENFFQAVKTSIVKKSLVLSNFGDQKLSGRQN